MITYPIGSGFITAETTIGGLNDFPLLVCGTKLASGSATHGEIKTINTLQEAYTYFGQKSHISKQLRSIFRILNISPTQKPAVMAIGMNENAGGVKASGTITFTNNPTENGSMIFYVDSKKNGKYEISILSTDTPTTIATKLANAINADVNADYTATPSTNVVTITYSHKGTIGNTVLLDFNGSVNGLTVVKSGNYLANGATDPVLTSLFSGMADKYNFITCYPSTWDYDVLKNFLTPRQNVVGKILDGQGMQCIIDTYTNLLAIGVAKPSDQYISRAYFHPSDLIENPDVFVCELSAQLALLNTQGAFVDYAPETTEGSIRNIGKPYHNLYLKNIAPLPINRGISDDEITVLEGYGFFTVQNNPVNTYPQTTKVVTGYYKNPQTGNLDKTYSELCDVFLDKFARKVYVAYPQQAYPRHSLVNGKSIPGVSINKADIFGILEEARKYLQNNNINDQGTIEINGVNIDIDDEWEKYVNDTLVINTTNGSFTVTIPFRRVGQLRTFTINVLIKQ